VPALRAEGLRVVAVNSNPATIMTDPELADATYIEPITPEFVTQVIEKERPTPCSPPWAADGPQRCHVAARSRACWSGTAWSSSAPTSTRSVRGEDRQEFKAIVESVGGSSARSAVCHTMTRCSRDGRAGYPVVVRRRSPWAAAFRHRARRGGAAPHRRRGLDREPTTEVLLEESSSGGRSTSSS
jgi:carbamoyl-phosphate synthase large subunit